MTTKLGQQSDKMLTKEDVMNTIEDATLVNALRWFIEFSTHVAEFLLNTGRVLRAIELCKECLIFLNSENVREEYLSYILKLGTAYKTIIFKAYCLIPDYTNVIKYGSELLVIFRECGVKQSEGIISIALAGIYEQQYKYAEARELYEKAINIAKETGDRDRKGQANAYGKVGAMSCRLGEYVKAKEYLEKALEIRIEIGDRGGSGEAIDYGNLATVFHSLGELDKAKEYLEKALAITIEIDDRQVVAAHYVNLGIVFRCLCKYVEAKHYLEKALAINIDIGDKKGLALCYGLLGSVFVCLRDYEQAKEYLNKAVTSRREISDKEGGAADTGNLGQLFHYLGEPVMAEKLFEKALSITQDTGNAEKVFQCRCGLIMVKLSQGKDEEALNHMLLGINKNEDLRNYLKDNDQFKISFSDGHVYPYLELSASFCVSGNPNNALYVLELARARALADLMATQYSVERQISADPQSWIGIENIMKKESNCVCLYISYYKQDVFLWILKSSGVIYFRRLAVNENIVGAGLVSNLTDFFDKSFRNLSILPGESCEDRSLNDVDPNVKSRQEESRAALQLAENDDEEGHAFKWRVSLFYRILIAPVADLLEEPEIIIAPDRSLNQVPFAALSDEGGKYLAESFRIRMVPSLSTLKLIQDSPADYHSQTGALIVGDPVVGEVLFQGGQITLASLPCARKEAEMIGELLGVQPLLGHCATKQVVLERLHSVSLVHFAAHGNAERGEIALSPLRPTKSIPKEEDFLLTMSDISQVRLRAKLVVLSCCHSGRGQIRAEGVVGIARAFLGSGARSVLVALWALDDLATEQFMRRFYVHLVRGESASESLHETMKWMRANGFTKVSEWAPFMLIGDNVTFDFGK